jgi:hypothetical protein
MIDKLSKIICDWHIDIINDAVKMSLSQLLMIFIYLIAIFCIYCFQMVEFYDVCVL